MCDVPSTHDASVYSIRKIGRRREEKYRFSGHSVNLETSSSVYRPALEFMRTYIVTRDYGFAQLVLVALKQDGKGWADNLSGR